MHWTGQHFLLVRVDSVLVDVLFFLLLSSFTLLDSDSKGITKIKSCSCSLILDIELVKPRLNSRAFSFSKSGGSSTNVDVLESLEVESHLLLDRLRFNLLAEWYI